MTTTLTPSTHRATFAIGNERTAKRVVDLLNESFFEGQAAIAAFERPDGRWDVSVHFAEPPHEPSIRELVGLAAGDDAAQGIAFDIVEAKDWVKATLEELVPVRAGRFVVHGRHDRSNIPPNKLGIEIEAALAFGTGHHGTTRGCLLLLDHALKAWRPRRVLDVGTGTGVLAAGISSSIAAGMTPKANLCCWAAVRSGPLPVSKPSWVPALLCDTVRTVGSTALWLPPMSPSITCRKLAEMRWFQPPSAWPEAKAGPNGPAVAGLSEIPVIRAIPAPSCDVAEVAVA